MSIREIATPYRYAGQGRVLVSDRLADGTPAGFFDIGGVSKVDIICQDTILEHFSSVTGAAVRDKVFHLKRTVNVAITVTQLSISNIAWMFSGGVVDIPGGVSNTVISAKVGAIHALDYVNVSSVVVTSADGSIIYVEGLNYTINAEAGSIHINEDQSVAVDPIIDGAALLLSFSYTNQTEISPFTDNDSVVSLRFEGLNTAAEDKPVVLNFYKVSRGILKKFSVLSGHAATVDLDLQLIADQTRNNAFFGETAVG